MLRRFGNGSTFGAFLRTVLIDPRLRRRIGILTAAIFVCLYTAGVLLYVRTTPDLGLRCAFTTVINQVEEGHYRPDLGGKLPQREATITHLAGHPVRTWPELQRTILRLSAEEVSDTGEYQYRDADGTHLVRVDFVEKGSSEASFAWCELTKPPLSMLLPTVLWFLIKAGLFIVGAVVLWKRPQEGFARLFFLVCLVSCGAYLGGYHWLQITTEPALILVFMVSSVLLPPVSLHFYLVFPRRKPLLQRHPVWVLLSVYGIPVLFLLFLLFHYVWVRNITTGGFDHPDASIKLKFLLENMLSGIYVYLVFSTILYVLSIVCLGHSLRSARDQTERSQVWWIRAGAIVALFPIGFSLGLALFHKERFAGGAATWPMFFASAFVTLAFAVSIARYRLLRLDQILTSGAMYVGVSVFAALVYYGLFFLAVFLLGSQVPSIEQALGVAGTVLVIHLLFDAVRGRVRKVLDRHFRREKHQLDHTLQRMNEAISQLVDAPTLCRRLLQSLSDLLGVERGAVYLRQGDPATHQLVVSQAYEPELTELPPGCPLVEALSTQGSALLAQPDQKEEPITRQLRFLGGEVAYPISHEGELLALLILGPKASGAYTPEDLQVVTAFAQVTALALMSGEGGRTIEQLNGELGRKVAKIAEQQRRILALQSQLTRRRESERSHEDELATVNGSESGDNGMTLSDPAVGSIIGSGPEMRQLLGMVRKIAGSDSAVLLRGESGTGKELLAEELHNHSPRKDKAFVKVHCAALAPTLLESELFGHIKGAFTGAVRDRVGRFELADGGTLFLDEIGDITLEVQTKLLRVLQEMTFERVGSSEPIKVDVRIIAATHQNLEKLIRAGRFREDLYYRLNVLPIEVPPLRERAEDIPELLLHFLHVYGQRGGKGELFFEDDALAMLKGYSWPGNVRQLENVVERAVVIAEGSRIEVGDLPGELLAPPEPIESANGFAFLETEELPSGNEWGEVRAVEQRRERERLVRALASAGGNKSQAARALGIARSTLLSRLKKHGLT